MIAEIFNASMSMNGNRLFSDISFVAIPGDRVALICDDGNAGTMVLQTFLGMRRLDSGWASFDGEPILPHLAACFRHHITYMPKQFDFGSMTVVDVAKALYGEQINHEISYSADKLADAMQQLGVDKILVNKPFNSLDPATSQRVAIALACIFERPIALFDNPTSHQDEAGRDIVTQFIASERFDDVAVVVATNSQEMIGMCNKTVRL